MTEGPFFPEEEIREGVENAFQTHKSRILACRPTAQVEHVGATAVVGSLTKGDVDLAVRVSEGDFDAAVTALESIYAIDQPGNWTSTYASFRAEPGENPPVGIQVSVKDSSDDFFVAVRDLLREDTALLNDYNKLKTEHMNTDDNQYLAAKARFMEHVLRERLGIVRR